MYIVNRDLPHFFIFRIKFHSLCELLICDQHFILIIMNNTSESGIVVDAGPASLDSEYDEYLDIPESDGSTFVNFSDAGEYC